MFKRHFVAESSTPARKSCFGLKKIEHLELQKTRRKPKPKPNPRNRANIFF